MIAPHKPVKITYMNVVPFVLLALLGSALINFGGFLTGIYFGRIFALPQFGLGMILVVMGLFCGVRWLIQFKKIVGGVHQKHITEVASWIGACLAGTASIFISIYYLTNSINNTMTSFTSMPKSESFLIFAGFGSSFGSSLLGRSQGFFNLLNFMSVVIFIVLAGIFIYVIKNFKSLLAKKRERENSLAGKTKEEAQLIKKERQNKKTEQMSRQGMALRTLCLFGVPAFFMGLVLQSLILTIPISGTHPVLEAEAPYLPSTRLALWNKAFFDFSKTGSEADLASSLQAIEKSERLARKHILLLNLYGPVDVQFTAHDRCRAAAYKNGTDVKKCNQNKKQARLTTMLNQ